jgi:hypothetical protein
MDSHTTNDTKYIDIEQYYLTCLQAMMEYIIEKQNNKLEDIVEASYRIERLEQNRLSLPICKEPRWHYYMRIAQITLSGDYPDDESYEHAVSYSNRVMRSAIDELSILPPDLLEDAMEYITSHHNTWQCGLCDAYCNQITSTFYDTK